MSKIKIDEKDYELSELSEEAKLQIMSIQYVDSELRKAQLHVAAMQTARNTYARVLKNMLEKGATEDIEEIEIEGLGDQIKFDD